MVTFQINGAKPLAGRVRISGSKNAVLPILCATLLTEEHCIIRNVPEIADVKTLVTICEGLGSKISFANHTLETDNSALKSFSPDAALVKKLRGSILLIGPLLSRFGQVVMPFPGGDLIGKRPIDTHLLALKDFGAVVEESDALRISGKLKGAETILNELSVTATENAIMAAVFAQGQSQIHLAAAEPHVQDLCRFLNAMGAKISGIGTHDIVIDGVTKLHGVDYTIISDDAVASSFMNLAAATKSELLIENIEPKYLYSPIIQLRQMNVNFEVLKDSIKINKPLGAYKAAKIKTNIFPGLMSDYIPPFAVLATQAEGKSVIHEWMYEGRLGYIHELAKMGARCRILDQHYAEIEGPNNLYGTNVSSLDLRSGMVLIIAALVAEGKSVLHDAEHIDRGYERIDEVLRSIGADIERVNQ